MERLNDAFVFRHIVKASWSKLYLFMSDVHFDSFKCDRKLLKSHLDEAKEKNADVIIIGDWFDAMGGKWDKRTSKEDIRPEYSTQTYFDDIIEDSAEFLMPYKDNIKLITEGNHETAVKTKQEIDLLSEYRGLCDKIGCKKGKYAGFIRYYFQTTASNRSSKVMYYTHGGGGNAPVTKGAIKSNRRQEAVQADLYVSGHIHTEFEIPRPQARLSKSNIVELYKPIHWQLGTYKNEYLDGGWADHKEFAPPNLGGRWVEFSYKNKKIHTKSWLTTI